MTRPNPCTRAMIHLVDEYQRRHAWLGRAAEQVDRWREEDRRAGIVWDDELKGSRNGR